MLCNLCASSQLFFFVMNQFQVYNICRISLGTPPTKFSWEYKDKSGGYKCVPDVTPSSFYQTVVKPVFDVDSKVC